MLVRKVIAHLDHLHAERGEDVKSPVRRAVAAAVIPNPWLRRTTTRSDLHPVVSQIAAPLGLLLTSYILKMLGSPDGVAGFGKGAIIGLDGELEHGAALLHTPYFGNIIRERLHGTDYISFADVQAKPGTPLVVPMAHKSNGGLRDYFETIGFQIADAPQPDEIVVVVAATDGPRPNARIGDRTTDRKVTLSEYTGHHLLENQVP